MFPESGDERHAQYSHGPMLGFTAAWANWISLVTLVPMEAVAAVRHMKVLWPWKWATDTSLYARWGI